MEAASGSFKQTKFTQRDESSIGAPRSATSGALILKVFTTLCKHKMNLHSVLLNDSFALDFICATPLEQFQILPLSAQVYPASASISSLEQCNLFPQVSTDSEFVYISGAGLAAKLTS